MSTLKSMLNCSKSPQIPNIWIIGDHLSTTQPHTRNALLRSSARQFMLQHLNLPEDKDQATSPGCKGISKNGSDDL